MRREAAFLMVVSLGSCSPNNAKNVTACRIEADRFYHMYKAVDPKDPGSQFVIVQRSAVPKKPNTATLNCASNVPRNTPSRAAEHDRWA